MTGGLSPKPKAKRPFHVSKHQYDPKLEGYGSVRDWDAAFRDMTGAEAVVILKGQRRTSLDIFGLTTLPDTLADLKVVYRQVMLRVHPDRGGTHEASVLAQAAYLDLQAQVKRRSK